MEIDAVHKLFFGFVEILNFSQNEFTIFLFILYTNSFTFISFT